jgi:hypothetical protein
MWRRWPGTDALLMTLRTTCSTALTALGSRFMYQRKRFGAGWTQPASLAREGHEEIVAALGASGAGETVGQNAAGEVVAEFPFHVGWHPLAVAALLPCAGEVGLQVLLHDLVEGCCLGMAAAIRGRSASLRLGAHVRGTVQSCR